MRIVTTIAQLRSVVRAARARGDVIGFVPTMGALHEGHLALVDAVRPRAGCVVMSIFVNPLQFGPGEDLAAYPRTLDNDAALAAAHDVDIVFAPPAAEMYPLPPAVAVTPVAPRPGDVALDARWEGAARPGHFAGVLTVVAKLFHIVQPDLAAFGRKDLQQLTLIRVMVRDLNIPVDIVAVPTVRAADGLALSSRNAYLSESERARALAVPRALDAMVRAWTEGQTSDANALIALGHEVLARESDVTADYLAIAEAERLEPIADVVPGAVAMVAARVGRTRLIDNVVFAPPDVAR
ncbi:MAG: pantoate--beta-alanine ligase [Gemmatimonadales bacterium]